MLTPVTFQIFAPGNGVRHRDPIRVMGPFKDMAL